jgi:hypothetical protein
MAAAGVSGFAFSLRRVTVAIVTAGAAALGCSSNGCPEGKVCLAASGGAAGTSGAGASGGAAAGGGNDSGGSAGTGGADAGGAGGSTIGGAGATASGGAGDDAGAGGDGASHSEGGELEGTPTWFGTAGGTEWRPELDDPRWAKADLRFFPFTSTLVGMRAAQYRLLYESGKLHVSIQVLADDTPDENQLNEAVYFGISDNNGLIAQLLTVWPDRTSDPVEPPAAKVPRDPGLPAKTQPVYVNWAETGNASLPAPTWTDHAAELPPWVEDLAYWGDSPGVKWAVTFKVDQIWLATGAVRIFVGARINDSNGVLKVANTAYVEDADSAGGYTIAPPRVADWESYDARMSCSVGPRVSEFGVVDGSDLTDRIAPTSNTFLVKVADLPTWAVYDHSLRLKLRIADWEANESDRQFAPWRLVAGISPTIFSDSYSVLADDPAWKWSFDDHGDGFGDATIEFTCQVQGQDDYCPVLMNSDGHPSQRMLVEVEEPVGDTPVCIVNRATYHDVNYAAL